MVEIVMAQFQIADGFEMIWLCLALILWIWQIIMV